MSIYPLRYYDKIQEDDLANYTLWSLNDSTDMDMDQVEIEVSDDLQDSFKKMIDNEVVFQGSFTFVTERRIRRLRFRS